MKTNVYYEGQIKYLEAQERGYLTPKNQAIIMQFDAADNSYVFFLNNQDTNLMITKIKIWSDDLEQACRKAKAFSAALKMQSLLQ